MKIVCNYQLTKQIGSGAFGETWLAQRSDHHTGEPALFVIKQLKMNRVDHWSAIERFHREANLMKQLDHPGIPNYIDFIEEEDFIGIVQEYISGNTLEDLILKHPEKFTQNMIQSILTQGLEILSYLQSLSPAIIHRDISPKNCILDQNNKLYLIDFGSVQKSYLYSSDSVTCMGTFGYMAPEQLRGQATIQSDLFSFGMVILTLIAQKPVTQLPVDNNTGKIDINQILKSESKAMREMILQLTALGPEKRFKTAQHALNRESNDLIDPKTLLIFKRDHQLYLQWLKQSYIKHKTAFRFSTAWFIISFCVPFIMLIMVGFFPNTLSIGRSNLGLGTTLFMFFTLFPVTSGLPYIPCFLTLLIEKQFNLNKKSIFQQHQLKFTHKKTVLSISGKESSNNYGRPLIQIDEKHLCLSILLNNKPLFSSKFNTMTELHLFKRNFTTLFKEISPDRNL